MSQNAIKTKRTLIAETSISVDATPARVWNVLITPETIQKVMLGMQPKSDWKVGSELRWIGRHEEKPNDNARGIIQVMDANKKLQFTFYYPGYGYPDQAEYHNTVVFNLSESNSQTSVDVEQGDFSVFKEGETFRSHSQTFWESSLKILKELAEGQK
jgi:uncharacterized protein YndB with AHSA1/START domain